MFIDTEEMSYKPKNLQLISILNATRLFSLIAVEQL